MSIEYVRYVAGFLICGERVLLIRKSRPEWQRGRLNGIGGHIETGESPAEAMRREFREEAGLDIDDWEHFATVRGDWWGEVWFFRLEVPSEVFFSIKTGLVDEGNLERRHLNEAQAYGALPNLSWLLPLAAYRHDSYAPVIATEATDEH